MSAWSDNAWLSDAWFINAWSEIGVTPDRPFGIFSRISSSVSGIESNISLDDAGVVSLVLQNFGICCRISATGKGLTSGINSEDTGALSII